MIPANYSIMLIDIKDDTNLQNVLSSYPIYDEKYRDVLNKKILDHYAYQEIGFETPFLFAHYLKVRLNEIMDKYNLLYKSELLKLDPLGNYNLKENFERENTGEANSNSTSDNTTNTSSDSTSKMNHVFQNTPQGELAHEDIDNYSYATTHDLESNTENATGNKTTTTNMEDTTTSTSTENYIKNIIGNKGMTVTNLFKEFVNNFTSIDKLIIDELSDLFMQIY